MPVEWNGKVAVRAWELIPKYYKNMDVLKSTLTRHKDKPHGLKRLQSGGNGRELLIDFDSLELSIKEELGDPRKVESWMDTFYDMDEKALSFYGSYRFESGNGMEERYVLEYAINASTLNASIKLRNARVTERKSKRITLRGVPSTIWKDTMNYRKLQMMKYGYEHTLPSNERRFLEALKLYEEYGYEVLISKKHENKNAMRLTADVVNVLSNLFAGQHWKPTMTEVKRQYKLFQIRDLEVVDNETGEIINPEGYPDLSERTILGYLAKWDSAVSTTRKRAGNRQLHMGKYKPAHRYDRPEFANSTISIDDREPPFAYTKNGKRLAYYIGIDLMSEVWVSWVNSKDKDEALLVSFYRQLIRNYVEWGVNMPRELECESSLNSLFKNTLLMNGVMFERVNILPNSARSKKIERYIQELRYREEKELEGWKARPHALSEANQVQSDKAVVVDYAQIVQQCNEVLANWNQKPHPQYKDKTRMQVFLENQNPDCKPIKWQMVLKYIGKETKTSCRVGIVELNGEEFVLGHEGKVATGDTLINLMRNAEGKKLRVMWLDGNDGKVLKAFAYVGDRMVCELVPVPRYNRAFFERNDKDREAQTLMNAYVGTIDNYAKRKAKEIKSITVIDRSKERALERQGIAPEPAPEVEVLEWPEEEPVDLTPRPLKSLLDSW